MTLDILIGVVLGIIIGSGVDFAALWLIYRNPIRIIKPSRWETETVERDITYRLTEVGGFDDVAVLCSEARDEIYKLRKEIERLKEKSNKQAMTLQRLTPEQHPDVLFIHALLGEKDHNGMPEKLLVVPAYGVDFSYVYERTDKTTGSEW